MQVKGWWILFGSSFLTSFSLTIARPSLNDEATDPTITNFVAKLDAGDLVPRATVTARPIPTTTANTTLNRDEPFPWTWQITPFDPQRCPSPSVVIGTFAWVNAVSTVLALLAGHRKLVAKITCGLLGKPWTSSWTYLWVVQVALGLGANALNAYITQHAPGYDDNKPAIWDLMLFYTTRPRLAWVVLALVGSLSPTDVSEHGFWTSSARQTMISEAVFSAIAAYYLGRVLHFDLGPGKDGQGRGALGLGQQGRDYYLMVYGALFTVGFYGFFIVFAAYYIVRSKKTFVEHMKFRNDSANKHWNWYMLYGFMPWIASWTFLVGWVRLTKEWFCPPEITAQGFVWTGATVIGVLTGTGV